jgi:hypothetical protein
MKTYIREVLPEYTKAYNATKRRLGKAYLLEDGDGAYSKRRPNSLAQQARDAAGIICVKHPANSPDLNASEPCWNM